MECTERERERERDTVFEEGGKGKEREPRDIKEKTFLFLFLSPLALSVTAAYLGRLQGLSGLVGLDLVDLFWWKSEREEVGWFSE